jgi:hypothetical protein
VRALTVLLAVLEDYPKKFLLLASASDAASSLRALFELQPSEDEEPASDIDSLTPSRDDLLFLFLQQATSTSIGPWLNGWRSALAAPPGSLLVVRSADFPDFQRNAPDLESFYGPKLYDSSILLSMWSEKTARAMKATLPKDVVAILKELPGPLPSKKDIEDWIRQHP